MKKIILFILCLQSIVVAAQLKSHVDERVELTSLVFRLAGAEEYVNNEVKKYTDDVDAFFGKYKNHELIQFARKIRDRDSVAYNAVIKTNSLLQIKNGNVELVENADIDCLLQDPRWKRETFLTFVDLLNKFYKDTNFQKFFKDHRPLYSEVEKRFDTFLSHVNTGWFLRFFGKPLESPVIHISLLNGLSNYGGPGCSDGGSIFIGCSRVDKDGIPDFNYYNHFSLFYALIHELCHIFTSPISERYSNELSYAGDLIFPYVKEDLLKVAYGNAATMLSEGLNNLCTLLYCKDNEVPPFLEYHVRIYENHGFIWLQRAMKFMENFKRGNYSTIEDFMPQYIGFMNFSAKNIEQIIFENEHRNPYVVEVYPSIGSTVSANIHAIRVDFSAPMASHGISFSKDTTLIFPEFDGPAYFTSEKTLIIPVKLEKSKNYGFILPAGYCQSLTYPMREDFEIKFSTEK